MNARDRRLLRLNGFILVVGGVTAAGVARHFEGSAWFIVAAVVGFTLLVVFRPVRRTRYVRKGGRPRN